MILAKGVYIDAHITRNICKYINHSCDPNSTTERWIVNKIPRIGIFAIKDVEIGEEISFDYKLQEPGKEAIVCRCGSDNCSGYIGLPKKSSVKKILYEVIGCIVNKECE